MRYKSIFILLAVAIPTVAFARIVGQAEALKVATSFFNGDSEVQPLGVARTLREIWNSDRLQAGDVCLLSTDAPTFYVFAPDQGKGFVIVSAEDATRPILGYSFEDDAPTGDLPCNLKSWLGAMHSHINQVRAEGRTATEEIGREWAKASAFREVFILQTAKWNQFEPYNLQCPITGNYQCVTGCVATGLSIVMRYHQWPEIGHGQTEPYVTSSYDISIGSRDLEHEYDWDDMPLEYESGQYTSDEADAVSTLMADVGCLIKSEYGPWETTARYADIINQKFYEHFDYSPMMCLAYKSSYTDDEWLLLLKAEMRTNGPIDYCGNYGGLSIGHFFVLDGYTDDDYFHINWGWGDSSSNGFYLLTEIDYAYNQTAILNFRPNDGSETISSLCEGAENMLDAVWRDIVSSCGDVAGDYEDSYESLLDELRGMAQEMGSASDDDTLTEGMSESLRNRIEEIAREIRQMQESARRAENDYLYDAIAGEMRDVGNLLKAAWETITTDYADVAGVFRGEYESIADELGELWQDIEDAHGQVGLTRMTTGDVDGRLDAIRQRIEDLLAAAQSAHAVSGVECMLQSRDDGTQIYNTGGIRVPSMEGTNVYILRCPDGRKRKVFMK